MGFGYRAAIGELIYAMVTCIFAVANLSQYSNAPAICHFQAINNVSRYLIVTKYKGLTYWRKKPCQELLLVPDPTPITPKK